MIDLTFEEAIEKAEALNDVQALEGAAAFFENLATGANSAPLAYAQAIRRALSPSSPAVRDGVGREAISKAREHAATMPDATAALKNDARSFLRSAAAGSPSHKAAIKAAWDAYVDASVDAGTSNLEAMAVAISAYHVALSNTKEAGE